MIFNWFSLKARSKLCNYKTVLPGYTQYDEPILSSSIAAKVIIYTFFMSFSWKILTFKTEPLTMTDKNIIDIDI